MFVLFDDFWFRGDDGCIQNILQKVVIFLYPDGHSVFGECGFCNLLVLCGDIVFGLLEEVFEIGVQLVVFVFCGTLIEYFFDSLLLFDTDDLIVMHGLLI